MAHRALCVCLCTLCLPTSCIIGDLEKDYCRSGGTQKAQYQIHLSENGQTAQHKKTAKALLKTLLKYLRDFREFPCAKREKMFKRETEPQFHICGVGKQNLTIFRHLKDILLSMPRNGPVQCQLQYDGVASSSDPPNSEVFDPSKRRTSLIVGGRPSIQTASVPNQELHIFAGMLSDVCARAHPKIPPAPGLNSTSNSTTTPPGRRVTLNSLNRFLHYTESEMGIRPPMVADEHGKVLEEGLELWWKCKARNDWFKVP
ncbi:hypothetical protein FIBSPDRAFT_897789 [Athelia psychrophila]|uniref:Uncharacterized protein n=1 Tax=Athelia psychrophila TaxID=1759441 RepID=A0A166BRC9_9AGAM|nr:hypothetical protein FIBSPDRAFT_897789 [Fibularhizoctonia sp. CBS 109695]